MVDNALSLKLEELVDFFNLVRDYDMALSQTLQIGKDEMIALKQRGRK